MGSTIYELDYSGQEVNEAIAKINNLDPTNISGGIIELESSEATPFNLDFLRSPGIYKAAFVYVLTCPSGVEHCTPVFIFVYRIKDNTPNGRLLQSLYAGDAVFNRSSLDAGVSWDYWASKDGLDKAVEITPDDIGVLFDAVLGASVLDRETKARITSTIADSIPNAIHSYSMKRISC